MKKICITNVPGTEQGNVIFKWLNHNKLSALFFSRLVLVG